MTEQQKKPRRKLWKRILLASFALLLVLGLLGWVFLPRIAEKVMNEMLAEADLEQADFTVREIGWDSALIEEVTLADDIWKLTAKEIKVDYDVFDLLKGRVNLITLSDSSCVVDFSKSRAQEAPEGDGASEEGSNKGDELSHADIMHQLPEIVEQIGGLRAEGLALRLKRADREVAQQVDINLDADGAQKFDLTLLSEDFHMQLGMTSEEKTTVMTSSFNKVVPDRLLKLLEILIDYEGSIIPDGFQLGAAELLAELRCEGEVIKPLGMTGELTKISYDGGDKPIQMRVPKATLTLMQDFSGPGYVTLSGGMDELSLPLDPSAGFVLIQKKNPDARWETKITWGGESAELFAKMEKIHLQGTYDKKPISLEDFHAEVSLVGEDFTLQGAFADGDTLLPVRYSHSFKELPDDWKLRGDFQLGPVKHEKPLLLLRAVTDLFEGIELAGTTNTNFKFSVGAFDSFEGVLTTRVSDLSTTAADGLIKAEGLNGLFQLHLLPLTISDLGEEDPSYYSLDFTSKKLHIGSKDALDFDLNHSGDQPVVIQGKGKLGSVVKLDGVLENLTLHGEHDGKEIDLVDTGVAFSMLGDEMKAKGSFQLKGNTIPFTYRHTQKTLDEGWDLAGLFEIPLAELNEPIDNADILMDAMEGISLTGKVAMKMDFSLGDKKDFDGVLAAAISGGALTFADDGPVIEGVKGDIRLSSMKTKQTAAYHRVTATKIKAFDIDLTNARLDYQILPSGDIQLKNIAMRGLDGNIWLDPFVLPGEEKDYGFKVRMKNLNLAKLAALFPDFNGRITGNIDGLLPMQNKGGEFIPQRGGMYLTPGKRAKLVYDAGNKFSGGLNPKGREYQQMKMVENSLKDLELKVLSIRLFDPRDKDKAVVLKLQGQASSVPGSPPIILNINGFKPDDDTVDFFDLLLKHRDKLNFGL